MWFVKSCRYVYYIIAFVCVLLSCSKGGTGVSCNESEELKEFKKYVSDTRKKLLYEQTYDTTNIIVADSIYNKAVRLNSDWCKLCALELKYYAYINNPSKEKEYLAAIDEYLKIASSNKEFRHELYDGTYTKVQYLIGIGRYIYAQQLVKDLMKEAERTHDEDGQYTCYYLMGAIGQDRGYYSMAILSLRKAEKFAKTDSLRISLVARELSKCYLAVRRYGEAIAAAKRACSYAANNRVYKVWGEYTYLASLYDSDKKEEFVEEYTNSTICNEDVDGVLPKDMQLSLQSRMAASSEEWDSAEVIARKIVHEKSMQKELFSIFRRKGDFKRAYETKERINELDDSVRSKMQTEDLNEMSERLDNSLLKVKADQLKIENEHIMFGAVVVALTFVIFMVAFVAVWYVRHRSARNKKKAMEERELFYRNVTHQLRTPMTVVLGMVEQLKQHIPVDDIVGRESLEAARRQSDNLLDLIKKLIAASRDGELVELSDGSAQKPIVVDRRDAEPTVTGVAGSRIIRPLPVNMVVSHVVNAVYSSSIVVAEDNDDVAMLICNMLRGKGYKVNRAADGVEAMDIMREELPDMLITDIAMPRMDGLELMRKVRSDETMCCLPIVVVSARVEDQERMDGINAGAEVFLAKPFINEELLLIVNKLLEQRRRLKQMFTSSIPDAETSRQVPDADVEFFNEINRLIDTNLVSGDVSTSFLAEKLSTSVSTLNRRLKNMSGLTSTTYIRNRRMLMAKRLLETTDQTISEIEVLCGFNTSGHFSRVFKAETGLSPLDYRKQRSHS